MLAELARMLLYWRPAFPRHKTWIRAIAVLLGLIVAVGRRTLTASILARGGRFVSWANDYLVFARARWDVFALFQGVLKLTLETIDRLTPDGPLVVAVDDTSIRKTGKKIAAARLMRDPSSPPFHINLRRGLRYLHLCAIVPLHRLGFDPRAVSIAFEPAPCVKKPGKRASEEQLAAYYEAKKINNLSQNAVSAFRRLRTFLNDIGEGLRRVLVVCDASYTNSTVLAGLPNGVDLIGRTRSDLALCEPAPTGSGRRVYGRRLPTPDAMRRDDSLPWTATELYYAGQPRKVRFKQIDHVLWERGAKRRPLRLIILAPTPYHAPKSCRQKWHYREPAYLLTTDRVSTAELLIQAYLDRWQIELEHRDLKSGLGVGQAQVWNDNSVSRLHSSHVAMWSMVKLAALRSHGPTRTNAYPPRPSWYPQQPNDRPSQQDMVDLLRSELAYHQRSAMPSPHLLPPPKAKKSRTKPSQRRQPSRPMATLPASDVAN